MFKNLSSFFQQKSYKDPECATNTCTTDASYTNKSGGGKFTRKQDVSLIEKKKKQSNEDSSLLCYMTPKNCQQSSKLIKQKVRESMGDLGIDSMIESPRKQPITKTNSGKYSFKGFEPYRPDGRKTSIEKHKLQVEEQNKFMRLGRNSKQSAAKTMVLRESLVVQNDKKVSKSPRTNLSFREQDMQHKNKSIPASYQKEMKKLKNQSQHFSNLLEMANKQRLQGQAQIKSLNSLVNELKQKNNSLMKSSEQLSREMLQLNANISELNSEKEKFKKDFVLVSEEKIKLEEEVSYLKDTVKELNQRIEVMLEAEKEFKMNLKTNFVTSNQPSHSRRFNSALITSQSALKSQPSEEQNRVIHELSDQLKYCQVEISMLKRVKMDINKKNEEFIKLQKQNKLLKNQLFDMKTADFFQENTRKNNYRSTARLSNQNKGKNNICTHRNNFLIGPKGQTRTQDQKSDSHSSDTLSLNLSLSPEKGKPASNTHRV